MSVKKSQTLETNEQKSLQDLLLRSRWTKDAKTRHTLCIKIGIDINNIDSIESTPQVFSTDLVYWLIQQENLDALLWLCREIKPDLNGQLISSLNSIYKKICYQNFKINRLSKLKLNGNSPFKLLFSEVFVLLSTQAIVQPPEPPTNQTKNIIQSSLILTLLVIFVRWFGVLLPFELIFYDLFMKFKFPESIDERTLIVEITDEELEKWNEESISDKRLQELLKVLEKGEPKVIGIDILRDKAQPEGDQESHNNLIHYLEDKSHINNIFAICSYTESINEKGGLPPSSKIQFGFSNVLPDKNYHGVIRRQLLGIDNEKEGCNTDYPLSYLLATRYLELQGKKVEYEAEEDYLKIGEGQKKTIFYPLEEFYLGGYQGSKLWNINVGNEQGDQILINYRNVDFAQISVTDVIELAQDQTAQDLLRKIKDRIVLIGYTGRSKQDLHFTPVDPEMPGVELHAHMVSQIVNAVLEERPLLMPLSFILEVIWIGVCSLVGGILAPATQSYKSLFSVVTIAVLVLFGISYLAFIGGLWLPIIPSIVGLFATLFIVKICQSRTWQQE